MRKKKVLLDGTEIGSMTGDGTGKSYNNSNDNYEGFLAGVQETFNKAIKKNKNLFFTDVDGNAVYKAYIENLPTEAQQHYICWKCEHFFVKYGGLVVLSKKGTMKSALWDEKLVPEFFKPCVKAMKDLVLSAKVTGDFLPTPEEEELGTSFSGGWSHISIKVPEEMIYRGDIYTANQVMKQNIQDYKTLLHGMSEFTIDVVRQAVNLTNAEALFRSEKCDATAKWLLDLYEKRNSVKSSKVQHNITWLAVANAPTGFCSFRNNILGTLLEDISAGSSFEVTSRNFKFKLNPTKYQRTTLPPKAGNVAQGEKLIKKMGAEQSLERRFAQREELKTIWTPKQVTKAVSNEGGVFGHIQVRDTKPQQKIDTDTAPIVMTWDKFYRTVVPNAESMELLVPSISSKFSAILTAVHEDAPPIIQWDLEDNRNPFSWYVYKSATPCSRWNLTSGYTKVTALTLQPSMWNGGFEHQGKSVFFILEGAKDARHEGAGNALFPEILKSELHEVRATIEAYSRTAQVYGYAEASACGVRLGSSSESSWDTLVRVKTNLGTAVYKLNRWD